MADEPGATGVKNTVVEPVAVIAATYTLAWVAVTADPKLPTRVSEPLGAIMVPPASEPTEGWSIAMALA